MMPGSQKRKRVWQIHGTAAAAVGVALTLALSRFLLSDLPELSSGSFAAYLSKSKTPSSIRPLHGNGNGTLGNDSAAYLSKSKTTSSIRLLHGSGNDTLGNDGDRIAFRLVRSLPGEGPLRNATLGGYYRCSDRAAVLPPPLDGRNVLDFATLVTTNLRTLLVGDSVGQQFSEILDESAGMLRAWHHYPDHKPPATEASRRCIQPVGGFKEQLAVSSPLRGGGANAYWRMTDLWQTANKGKQMGETAGGGWNDVQATLLAMAMPPTNSSAKFDTVVLNYNSWTTRLDPGMVTRERYEESIRLAGSVFGADAVVIVTYPFNREVATPKHWEAIRDANDMLRRLAADGRSGTNGTSPRPTVLLLEFANFTNQLLWHNARHLGLNVSDPRLVSGEAGWEVRDDAMARSPVLRWMGHVVAVCAANMTLGKDCPKNYISNDDMHWCAETIGARLSAGVACLLGCAFNKCTPDVGTNDGTNRDGSSPSSIHSCERECNDRFMSLSPVDAEWMASPVRSCMS